MNDPVLLAVVDNLSRFLVAASVALLGVYFYDWTTPFGFKSELSEKDNPAFGINLMGYIIGLMVLVMGATAGSGGELSHPLDIAIFGLLAIVLLRIGAWLTDRFILRSFSVWKEITEDRNLGVGFATAGVFIATGYILKGALTGDSAGVGSGLVTTTVYFVLSQIVLVAAAFTYMWLTHYRHTDGSRRSVLDELRDNDNPAVGLSFGGFIVGTSLVIAASIDGNDITSWVSLWGVVQSLVLSSALGVAAMLSIRPFIDRAVVPYASVNSEVGEQKNVAIAGINAAFYVGLGAILYALIA